MNISVFTAQEFERHLQRNKVFSYYYQTAAGILHVFATTLGVHRAVFIDNTALEETIPFATAAITQVVLVGTQFQIQVWHKTLAIPVGKTITYQELAHAVGRPNAWRAVANALGDNQIPSFIPCHRIMRKNGALGGYTGGIEKKIQLLRSEGCVI